MSTNILKDYLTKDCQSNKNIKSCSECDEYSRARADAEQENQEKLESFFKFLAMRKREAQSSLKNYTGSDKSQAEKFMAAIYRKEIALIDDMKNIAQFFELMPAEDLESDVTEKSEAPK